MDLRHPLAMGRIESPPGPATSHTDLRRRSPPRSRRWPRRLAGRAAGGPRHRVEQLPRLPGAGLPDPDLHAGGRLRRRPDRGGRPAARARCWAASGSWSSTAPTTTCAACGGSTAGTWRGSSTPWSAARRLGLEGAGARGAGPGPLRRPAHQGAPALRLGPPAAHRRAAPLRGARHPLPPRRSTTSSRPGSPQGGAADEARREFDRIAAARAHARVFDPEGWRKLKGARELDADGQEGAPRALDRPRGAGVGDRPAALQGDRRSTALVRAGPAPARARSRPSAPSPGSRRR